MKFILSYDAANQAILCLQMRLMGRDIDIVHRTNDYLADADYWSRLDADLCSDPSFQCYLPLIAELHKKHPPPTKLPMRTAIIPYYRGPRTLLSTARQEPARTVRCRRLMPRQRNTWTWMQLP
jgi:hypothetical protein